MSKTCLSFLTKCITSFSLEFHKRLHEEKRFLVPSIAEFIPFFSSTITSPPPQEDHISGPQDGQIKHYSTIQFIGRFVKTWGNDFFNILWMYFPQNFKCVWTSFSLKNADKIVWMANAVLAIKSRNYTIIQFHYSNDLI